MQSKEKISYVKDHDGFYTVANFSHATGIAEAFIDKALGPISIIRLKVHSKSGAWIILNEVNHNKKERGSRKNDDFYFRYLLSQ